ncbi:hypothetical protein BKA59DRAFT_186429 [Fusarium tricinctum]|uniref:Uncharacterized protein n=1 Tax=Fusarium tricinctum TaxID=61284 RepID=A0A8K0RUJ6_9HYPO|nr:hypothetical protein BKA59DRAFT_186429 [Fusarium tricinctum]
MDMDNVTWWLPELHAVLDIPTEPYRPLLTLHKSFSDFLLSDESVCNVKYGIEAAQIHALLAARCIQLMTAKLKQDICEIRRLDVTPYEVNSETINRFMPLGLQYACIYWFYHLETSGKPLDNQVCDFLFQHFLHWLKALSLIGRLPDGADALIILTESIKASPTMSPEVLAFMKDATRTISRFGPVIGRSPLQTYASVLLFSPLASKVRQMFWNTRLPASSYVQGVELGWDAHLQARPCPCLNPALHGPLHSSFRQTVRSWPSQW